MDKNYTPQHGFIVPSSMRSYLLTVILLIYGLTLSAKGAELIIPLTIPFEFMTMSMLKKHNNIPEDMTILRYQEGCNNFTLDHPQFGRQGHFVRFVSHGTGSAGFEVFSECHNPVDWQGYIEFLATPSITPDWQLRLGIDHSNLYDEDWQKGLFMEPIWNAVQHYVLPSLTDFTIDLTPPRDDALSLMKTFVSRNSIAQTEAIFRSAKAKAITVDDYGINVDISLFLPENLQQQVLVPVTPSKPLSPEEITTLEQKLEQWDAFLVFIIKNIGDNNVDPSIREQLFDLLLTSRYQVLPILAGENNEYTVDPVRALFIETWNRLQEIIRSAEEKGIKLNDAFRYSAFIRAGNMLLTFDRIAPGIGMEISADGLRQLARILQPTLKADPLIYNQDQDPELRQLLGLPAELPDDEPFEEVPEHVESSHSLLGIIKNLYAAELPKSNELYLLKQRFDHWVPKSSEFDEYKVLMNNLLLVTTEQKLTTPIADQYKPVFRNLVLATALKESCWRQFVVTNDKVTYLSSPSGSIGLMQINPYVWRGFYKIDRLRWNIYYNAVAGTEILSHYLLNYAIKSETTNNVDNIARATYAIYNAGPSAVGRYRKQNSSSREKKVDNRFWEIYRGFKANDEVDLFHCTLG
jgi:hypothetical protein